MANITKFVLIFGVSDEEAADELLDRLFTMDSWGHLVDLLDDVRCIYIHKDLEDEEPVRWVAIKMGIDIDDYLILKGEIDSTDFGECLQHVFKQDNLTDKWSEI